MERLFGTSYETQIFFESDLDIILKIEDKIIKISFGEYKYYLYLCQKNFKERI